MPSIYFIDFIAIAPEFFMGVFICIFLFFGPLCLSQQTALFRKTFVLRDFSLKLSLLILLLTLILLVNSPIEFFIGFYGCLVFDFPSYVAKVLLVSLGICAISVSKSFVKHVGFNSFECFLVLLISLLALLFIVSSFDLLGFYIAFELQSLAFYVLASFKRSSAFSTEAGLKYLIMGAFSSGLFLFGTSLIYGAVGTTNYAVFKLFFSLDFLNHFSIGLLFGLVFVTTSFFF